uniref:Androglobin n=1 Tax=Anabas testudineus TaxID=64144 RepID=A0A3Q1I5J2_ANATE
MSKTQPKKKEHSSIWVNAITSLVTLSESLESVGRCRFPIWPEWSDADVSKEKWASSKGAEDGKTRQSPSSYFEDPEGKIWLPASLKVHSWKRPIEFIVNKVLQLMYFLSLIKLMRWIISEIYIIWSLRNSLSTEQDGWTPWEHIYALCEVMKGHVPLYNTYGKYVVRLYWMAEVVFSQYIHLVLGTEERGRKNERDRYKSDGVL